jgi:hypothetical protein
MDRKHDQRLVAGRREKAGDQYVGINNRPDHLASRPADFSSRRCSAISALISSGVIASSPRRLAPAQAFVSQSGGGAAVRMKSCTHAHDDDGGFTAPVDDETFVVVHGQIHKLAELGAGDVGVYTSGHENLNALIN